MSADLPPDLAAKIAEHVKEHPRSQEIVDLLLAKRAKAGTPQAVAEAEQHLRTLVEPSSGAGWAWFFGAVALLILGWNAWDYFAAREHAAALARSAPAVAQVKRLDPADCYSEPRGSRCLRLELEVHRDGAAPYTAVLEQLVALEYMPRVQAGAWLKVGVQPDDPSVVLFDEQSLHVAPPPPPKH